MAKLNLVGVAALTGGGIFVYAGVKGLSVPSALRNILSGQGPSAATPQDQLTGFNPAPPPLPAGSTTGTGQAPGTTTAAGRGSGGPAPPVTGGSINSFAKAVLAGIGAPQTNANIASIEAWARREGGGGANNPLNTTINGFGGTNFNSVGVKNFPSLSVGAAATIATLRVGYGDIIMLLKSGQGLCGHALSGLSKWSGGGYSSVC